MQSLLVAMFYMWLLLSNVFMKTFSIALNVRKPLQALVFYFRFFFLKFKKNQDLNTVVYGHCSNFKAFRIKNGLCFAPLDILQYFSNNA